MQQLVSQNKEHTTSVPGVVFHNLMPAMALQKVMLPELSVIEI